MIKMLKDNLLVKRLEPSEKPRDSPIILPPRARELSQIGTVVSLGPECEHLLVGDLVMFGKYSGLEWIHDNEKYQLLKYKDVLLHIMEDTYDEV